MIDSRLNIRSHHDYATKIAAKVYSALLSGMLTNIGEPKLKQWQRQYMGLDFIHPSYNNKAKILLK